jgi:hypothetical protein
MVLKALAACALAWLLASTADPVIAQTSGKPSLDAILESGAAGAGDLRKIGDSLSSADPDVRIATLNAIVDSGDPSYIAKAMEIALTSDDPRLREAALRGKFNAGGTYRLEIDMSAAAKDPTDAAGWLRGVGGSISTDGTSGFFAFALDEFQDRQQCWPYRNSNACALSLAGEQVFYVASNANAQLRLDETGTLVGSLLIRGEGSPVPVRIPLVQ